MNFNIFIKGYRLFVFYEGPYGVVIFSRSFDLTHVIVGQGPEILGYCSVIISEVMGIEDNHLTVDFRITHAEGP